MNKHSIVGMLLMVVFLTAGTAVASETQTIPPAVVWDETFALPNEGDEEGNDVLITTDGLIAVAVDGHSTIAGKYISLILLNPDGSLHSKAVLDSRTQAERVIQTSDGGYLLLGHIGLSYTSSVPKLVKLDAALTLEWERIYYDIDDAWPWDMHLGPSAVIELADGYLVTGYRGLGYLPLNMLSDDPISPDALSQTYLLLVDKDGNRVWQHNADWSDTNGGEALLATPDGGYIVLTSVTLSQQPYACDSDHYIEALKFDSSHQLIWQQSYGHGHDTSPKAVIQTRDGGYAIAASSCDDYGGQFEEANMWLVKTDALGNIEWDATYANEDHGTPTNDLLQTADGGFIMTTDDWQSPWIIKTTADGTLDWELDEESGGFGDPGTLNFIVAFTGSLEQGLVVTGMRDYSEKDVWVFNLK